MSKIENKTLLEQLRWRYATKAFDPEGKIPEQDMETLEEALVLSPSSFGLQPWKFLVVTDKEIMGKLPAASWGQQQVKDCSHLVIFTVRKGYQRKDIDTFLNRMAEVRGIDKESLSGYEQFAGEFVDAQNKAGTVDAWSRNQVYIALGQLLSAAALIGVDACPMEGIDAGQYDQILGLEGTDYATVLACPLGYRSSEDKYATAAKVRFPKSDVLERI